MSVKAPRRDPAVPLDRRESGTAPAVDRRIAGDCCIGPPAVLCRAPFNDFAV
jgi:hypothetical protein